MKVVKIILICVVSLAIILYILLPAGFGLFASLKKPYDVGLPPEKFSEIQLITDDGVQLQAWYKAPENGAAIILLHGANSSRESVRSYARMLSDNGFGVLALDMRGHGESKGSGNSFGWNSDKDIGAAIAYLSGQTEVLKIGGLGLSMGGEALLGAISTYPQIEAVVADGATQRSIDDYLLLPSRRSIIQSWSTRVMYASVALFTGDKQPKRLIDSIKDADNTKLLLIAAGNEEEEEEYNEYFQSAAGSRAELWVVPGAKHIGAMNTAGTEYEQRVISFLTDTLLGA